MRRMSEVAAHDVAKHRVLLDPSGDLHIVHQRIQMGTAVGEATFRRRLSEVDLHTLSPTPRALLVRYPKQLLCILSELLVLQSALPSLLLTPLIKPYPSPRLHRGRLDRGMRVL
jgi:hypothetical protein